MIIKKMTATYGKLSESVLELEPGLNIIAAPNESGKSTWCSFIKSMIYGVDSSAREKGGVKPDKTLYAPWSGAPMSGSMDIEHDGKEISISRAGTAGAPMRDCIAVYTGTSQPLRGVSGESLLGVPREVFERTAFIGQGGAQIGTVPELEKRIAAIVQTGDESASYTDAEERLRAAMRRRRHNKSGTLPELERQLAVLRDKLREIEREEARSGELRQAVKQAIARRDELTKQVAEIREKRRKSALSELNVSRERIHSLEAELEELKTEGSELEREMLGGGFGTENPETARGRVSRDLEMISELEADAEKANPRPWTVFAAVSAVLALVCAAPALFAPGLAVSGALMTVLSPPVVLVPVVILGALFVAAAINAVRIKKKREALSLQISALFEPYGTGEKGEILAAVSRHEQIFTRLEQLNTRAGEARARLDTERDAQKSRESEILRGLDFSGGDDGQKRRLEEAEAALRRLREEQAACGGRLDAMGGREALSDKIDEAVREQKRLSLEYDALSLAADTLREAGVEIQNRMTPRLSARAGEIFSYLTAGRYEAVALDRKLAAMARLRGDTIPRESAYLSAGALDQLYLAVRLALCELALPGDGRESCLLIMDDALGSFDDERCAAALSFLGEMSKSRQILLFTCHERESKIAEKYENVNIMSL